MPIPLEQTMCWDKSSQKNSANTPVLMMAAIARLQVAIHHWHVFLCLAMGFHVVSLLPLRPFAS